LGDHQGVVMTGGHYSMTDARNRLWQIVREAETDGPVTLTDRGRPVAVVMAEAEYVGLRSAKLGFWKATEVFRSSVDLSGLDIDEVYRDVRDRTPGRPVPA
jgi:prevent-host-death family protein